MPEAQRFVYWCRQYLGDAAMSALDWERAAMREVHAGVSADGNHVCMPRVCWKGRWKVLRFCRMLYWHWCRTVNTKGHLVMKRAHGLALQAAWDGIGLPPVQQGRRIQARRCWR